MIELKSNYQFVILASIGSSYGILLKSHTTPLKLTGLAVRTHSEGLIDIPRKLSKILDEQGYQYLWSEPRSFLNQRKTHLFLMMRTGTGGKIKNKELIKSFERFIVNCSYPIGKILTKKEPPLDLNGEIEFWFSEFLIDFLYK